MTHFLKPPIKIKANYLAAIGVTAAPLVYFLPALLSGRVLCPEDGLLQNVPFRVAAAQIMRSGYLPLWNPYIFSGMPLLATAQVGILYPLNWFYLSFSPATATNLMVVSTYMVAALGAYLYARRIGASIIGAAITSVVWQFSGATIGQISHINIAQTSAFVPWVLWSVDSYAAKGTFKRGAVISLVIAIQFFAGHQQTFVNSLLLLIAYVVVMAIANRELRRRYLVATGFVVTGLLLAAIQILPTFELLRRSERSAATYEFFTSFSMPKRFILTFIAPYLFGGGDGRLFRAPYFGPPFYPEMVGYVGLLALILALIAIVMKPDVRTRFWAIVAACCFLLTLGAYAPLGFYQVIYYLPGLNLFRVPARHLMEVDLALAVLAGRGFTILAAQRVQFRSRMIAVSIAFAVVIFTLLAVTVLRPADFHLAREAPLSILRAPELFMPVAFALISAYAIWRFARGKRGAAALVFAVLIFDLGVWGQSSDWYVVSPRNTDEYFHQPESVQILNGFAAREKPLFRILTAPHQFDPAAPPVPPSVSHSTDWVLWTQPDIYMMHGIQNAAGYDGFGLERYSQMAGRMKVWGELTDPDNTLRGDSREIDLANARYLLSMGRRANSTPTSGAFPKADQRYGDYLFAANDLGLPGLTKGKRLGFSLAPIEIDHIGLVTNLAWSENVPNDTTIARIRLRTSNQTLEVPVRAGADTAEWAYDRPDIRARIHHRRATVASSYQVNDAPGTYDAHMFVTAVALPQPAQITGGEIVIVPDPRWPDLSLSVFRISLINEREQKTYPLGRSMLSLENEGASAKSELEPPRWKLAAQTEYVDVYENARAMPRAWLASETRVLKEAEMLEVIRSGRFTDGSKWEPSITALIESPLSVDVRPGARGEVNVTRYEPNRIDVTANVDGPAILVLSENHYPGWRTYVDGRAVETLRVDYNLRGVPLPAGQHQIEFAYRPKSVIIGMIVSLFAIALLAGGIVIDRRVKSGGPPSTRTGLMI